MKILPLLFLMILMAKDAESQESHKVSYLKYLHYYDENTLELATTKAFLDSMYNLIIQYKIADSSMVNNLRFTMPNSKTSGIQPAELHIEIHGDTAWQYSTRNEKMISDYTKVELKTGKIFRYPATNRSLCYAQFEGFSPMMNYEITSDTADTKMISGFLCYKVKMKANTRPDPYGETSIEMYVTQKIPLPVHAVIRTAQSLPDFFPLEIRFWNTKKIGHEEVYKIMEIR